MQVCEEMVGKLVLGGFQNDALKLLRVDVAIAILVEELESLSNTLALETAQHLRKLRIAEVMALLLAANVQLCPLAVPVKGDVVGPLVELVESAEVIVLDVAGAIDIKQAECDFVFGIGLGEKVLKDTPIGQAQTSMALVVGNVEEN